MMVGKRTLTCAKCGVTSKEDSSLTFHRFPLPSMHGALKAKVWAKYCFPNNDWTSEKSLCQLHKQYKVLCSKHFDESAYTSNEKKRLNKFAIPFDAQNILAQVREELQNPLVNTQETQMELVPEVQASTSQSTTSSFIEQPSKEYNPQSITTGPHKGILKEIGVKSLAELTPRKLKMYKRCRKNLSEILRLRRNMKQTKKFKRNILEELHSSEALQEILESKMSSPFYLLLQSQLKNTSRKLAGRRWTLDDKVLALSIYKKSSSCYRLLRRLLCLPSVSSLKMLLNKIPLMCGINKQVMETIKEITQKRPVEDNLCILAFDEMSIRKNLTYNARLDQIDGYQDHASQSRSPEIACKAMTFMAIGIRKKWKQPMAFYFSGANVTADRLYVLIKEVLGACFDAGLEVIGTVNDCDGVNLRALNALGSLTEKPYFEFKEHEIVTILDPPHLLKCFRNNFMKHDIEFNQDVQTEGKKIKGVAKWTHIEAFFDIEKRNPKFVFAPALTQQHLQPNGKQKMKVRLAAQILSHSVASGLFAKVALNELPPDAMATATMVADMDKLFDAVNGDTQDRKRGKPLLTNISSTSLHLDFFSKMKKFFMDMKFLGARSKPPSQEGWLRTINAIERLMKNLRKFNVKTLSPRRLNQDPLENCFGCIRNNCGSNPNPTSVQFVAALKTSMVTNLININKNRNCVDDDNNILNNLKIFLCKGYNHHEQQEETLKPDSTRVNEVSSIVLNYKSVDELDDIPQCSGEIQACAYVCGFIAKNLDLKNCAYCKKIFLTDPNTEVCHIFTSFKEYDENKCSLNYIQPSFGVFVENAATIIHDYLNEHGHMKNIKQNLIDIICQKINTNCLNGCEEHDEINIKNILHATIFICTKRFCQLKNREFVMEASKQSFVRKIKILKNI